MSDVSDVSDEHEVSDEAQPTLLDRTRDIRLRFWREEVSEAEALALLAPFLVEWQRMAREKAAAAGMRAPTLSARKLLRMRHDLRFDAHDSHNAAGR